MNALKKRVKVSRSNLLIYLILTGVCLGTLVPGGTAYGQTFSEEPLVTDRPDQTESSNIVQTGYIQLEGGGLYERETDYGDVDTISIPQLLARIGLSPRVEFRLGGDGLVYINPENSKEVTEGSDLSVGGKIYFFPQYSLLPETAAIFEVSLPTGGSTVTSGGYDPASVLIFSWDLPEDFGLGVNVGFASPTQGEDSDDRIFETKITAALGIPLTERLGAFIEYFGTLVAEGQEDPHSIDGGFTYLINENLQLDMSGGVGLTDAAPDYFIGIGASWRFGLPGVGR